MLVFKDEYLCLTKLKFLIFNLIFYSCRLRIGGIRVVSDNAI